MGPAMPTSKRTLRFGKGSRMRMTAPSVPDLRPDEAQEERNEIGQRRVHAVVAARKVVPHLVRAENRQDRPAVPEAAPPALREVEHGAHEGCRDERQDEEQDVLPPHVLEARAGLISEGVHGRRTN